VLRVFLRLEWTIAAILAMACVLVVVDSSSLLFQDYPNHLARAEVLADLMFGHGHLFGEAFTYQFMAVPYIAGDLMLALAVHALGDTAATALWTSLVLLSVPLAAMFYLRVMRTPPEIRIVFFLLSLYLSTDWFFVVGFLNFRIGIALTIFALALAQSLRHRWSAPLFALYCTVAAIGYLMHLAFVIFLTVALLVSALYRLRARTTSLRREVWLLAPVAVLFIWYLLGITLDPAQHPVAAGHYVRGGVRSKLQRLDWDFVRFNPWVDALLMLMFWICLLWPIRRQLHVSGLRSSSVIEMLILAAVFLGMYLVLPADYGDVSYIDIRALPLVTLFLGFACVLLAQATAATASFRSGFVPIIAALLVIANLLDVAFTSANYKVWLQEYRAVIAALPRGAHVFSVFTHTRLSNMNPNLDADAFVVIDRGGVTPYLFSGDQGHPMKYFRYLTRPYAPGRDWYVVEPSASVDWTAIACSYDYMLVTRPFDPQRLRASMITVAENSSGALIAIDKRQCSAGGDRTQTIPTVDVPRAIDAHTRSRADVGSSSRRSGPPASAK
jgi:hypothetical protein